MNSFRLALVLVIVAGVAMSGILLSVSEASAVVVCQRKGKIKLRPQNCKTKEMLIGTLPQASCCEGNANGAVTSAHTATSQQSKGDELVTVDIEDVSGQLIQLEDRVATLEALHDDAEEVRSCSRSSSPECIGTCPPGLTCSQEPSGLGCACQLAGFIIERATSTTNTTTTTTSTTTTTLP